MPTSLNTVLGLAPKFGASYESGLRRYTETHVEPCALIVYERLPRKSEDGDLDEDDYRIHTIASSSFRRDYFASVELSDGKYKASEIFGERPIWPLSSVVEQELTIDREGKNPWRFETEVFTNSYEVFQSLRCAVTSGKSKKNS